MIVDTSALVAVSYREQGRERIARALSSERGLIPAPVLVELQRVTALESNRPDPELKRMIDGFLARDLAVEAFTIEDARFAEAANEKHGSGNSRGGRLNLLDLMVYGMAKRTGLPILCTGRDFAATGIPIHSASRID